MGNINNITIREGKVNFEGIGRVVRFVHWRPLCRMLRPRALLELE